MGLPIPGLGGMAINAGLKIGKGLWDGPSRPTGADASGQPTGTTAPHAATSMGSGGGGHSSLSAPQFGNLFKGGGGAAGEGAAAAEGAGAAAAAGEGAAAAGGASALAELAPLLLL